MIRHTVLQSALDCNRNGCSQLYTTTVRRPSWHLPLSTILVVLLRLRRHHAPLETTSSTQLMYLSQAHISTALKFCQ